MRVKILLPEPKPAHLELPEACRYEDCGSRRVRRLQVVSKKIKDVGEREVVAWRCECLQCGRTFRVYPEGVSRSQTSLRVKGLAVMLYSLGLSYGATSLTLKALGVNQSKSQVYAAVQEAARRVPGLRRRAVRVRMTVSGAGGDERSAKRNGKWPPLSLAANESEGVILTVDLLPEEKAEMFRQWLAAALEATGAKLLVTEGGEPSSTWRTTMPGSSGAILPQEGVSDE